MVELVLLDAHELEEFQFMQRLLKRYVANSAAQKAQNHLIRAKIGHQ
jgi:hypothetical protein